MNPFNPALAARAFMLISFTGPMTTWLKPWNHGSAEVLVSATKGSADAITCATPLAYIKAGDFTHIPSTMDMLLGNMPGCIGEVGSIALVLGGIYLLYRKVITWHIPVSFITTVYVYALLQGGAPAYVSVITGGILISAIFMATDYVTSPMSKTGGIVYGIGIGLITMLIRYFGAYPEGVSFAILIMNSVVPLLNKWFHTKKYGRA